jgi:hypothetical protein
MSESASVVWSALYPALGSFSMDEVVWKWNFRVNQVMGVLYPSTQHHYRRLILLILLYCYMFRSYDHLQAENILLARITRLTKDPLFYTITNIIVIIFYDQMC